MRLYRSSSGRGGNRCNRRPKPLARHRTPPGDSVGFEWIREKSSGACENLGCNVGDLGPAKLFGHGTFDRVYLFALPRGTKLVEAAGATVQSLAVKVAPRECRPVEDTDMEVRILHRLKGNPHIVQLLVACRCARQRASGGCSKRFGVSSCSLPRTRRRRFEKRCVHAGVRGPGDVVAPALRAPQQTFGVWALSLATPV